MTRQEIQDSARSYIGTPWRHQGRDRYMGVDCAGLVQCVAIDMKVPNPGPQDYTNYERQTDGRELMHILTHWMIKKPVEAAKPGDVILMKHITARWAIHCGVLTDLGRQGMGLVHSYGAPGMPSAKVVEQGWTEDWRKRAVAAFEFPGVDGAEEVR